MYRIYNVDLGRTTKYASFSGFFLSKNCPSIIQIEQLVKVLKSTPTEELNIISFDRSGERLEDYNPNFEFFDLDLVGDHSIVILDLNYVEEPEEDMELNQVFLTDSKNKIIVFKNDGEVTGLR